MDKFAYTVQYPFVSKLPIYSIQCYWNIDCKTERFNDEKRKYLSYWKYLEHNGFVCFYILAFILPNLITVLNTVL